MNAERASSVRIFLAKLTLNMGEDPLSQHGLLGNGSVKIVEFCVTTYYMKRR